jgi:soluble lytic murein transglycosylase-like protein
MGDKVYAAAIRTAADKYRLDYSLVLAICEVESGFDQWATRVEPAWKYLYFPRECSSKLGITIETETLHQCTSWGLMQVMGSVARELGYQEQLPRLCIPEYGLEYGCRKLRKQMDRYGMESDAVAAYNAGSVIMTTAGMYRNQKYVDKVNRVLIELRKLK